MEVVHVSVWYLKPILVETLNLIQVKPYLKICKALSVLRNIPYICMMDSLEINYNEIKVDNSMNIENSNHE